jgi:hypothetical protein
MFTNYLNGTILGIKSERSSLQTLLNRIVTIGVIDEDIVEEHSDHLRCLQMGVYIMCRIGNQFESEMIRRQKIADGNVIGIPKV